jgi:hypothetical protein
LPCAASETAVLSLSATPPNLQLASKVTISAGQTDGAFSFVAPAVDIPMSLRVTASNPQYSATGTLSVEPNVANSKRLSLAFRPAPQVGGAPVTGAVTLPAPAPSGGAAVTLQSNNAAARVATGITVPAGQLGELSSLSTRHPCPAMLARPSRPPRGL